MCGHRNKSLDTKLGLYGGWPSIPLFQSSKFSWLSRCVRVRIVLVGGWFSFFFWILLASEYLHTIQHWPCDVALMMSVLPKKQAIIYANNFCRIWLILKYLYSWLLFTFGLIRVDQWFVIYYDVLKHRHCMFLAFFSTNRHQSFFERLWNYVESNASNFLTAKCSCKIECILLPLMPKDTSISR